LTDARLLAEEEALFDLLPVGIALVEGRSIARCNRTLEQMLGYAHGELAGKPYACLADSDVLEGDVELRRKDGSRLWCRLSSRVAQDCTLVAFADVTEEIKRREDAVRFLAYHDSLTGLPNRRLLDDRFKQAVHLAQRRDRKVAAMLIDLDNFKQVNDSFGHRAGDGVLKEVAQRLTACVRKADTLARHGGDEFVVVISEVNAEADCQVVAEKILRALAAEFNIDGRALTLGASIGISLYPGDAGDGDALLRSADAAMYRAKQLGRNQYRFYGR